ERRQRITLLWSTWHGGAGQCHFIATWQLRCHWPSTTSIFGTGQCDAHRVCGGRSSRRQLDSDAVRNGQSPDATVHARKSFYSHHATTDSDDQFATFISE